MSEDLIEFDLALRCEIAIESPASVLWGYLDRPREWKDSVASIERIDGEPGEVGEVLRIGQRPSGEIVYTILKTLRLKHTEWKVQSLATENGRLSCGYVIHSLYERGGRTQLVYDFVARCRLPAAEAEGRRREEFARMVQDGTQAKIDADLLVLKNLIEGA